MSTSPLLIDESPLQVLPSLAVKIGLHEAIIVQQIHYWLKQPRSYKRNNRAWVYNTYHEWKAQFPFMSPVSIKRAMIKLEKKGLIKTAQFDIAKGDAKKYYTIDYAVLNTLYDTAPSDQSDLTHEIKMIPPSDQNDPTLGSKRSHLIRTETNTETNTESAPLAIFDEVFPGKRTIFSTQAIEQASISDERGWREALERWRTNGYSLRNIAGLIDSYKTEKEKTNGRSEWQRKREEFTRSTLEAFAAQEETRRKNRERYASEGDVVYITPPTLADKLAAERRRRDECAGVSVV